jgi:hypothetical protein
MLAATAALGVLLDPAAARAGSRHASGDDWCATDEGDLHARHCEVRETLAPAGAVRVDARPNGGIEVQGGARSDVRIEARVVAVAETEAEAEALAGQVRVVTEGGVRAEGPAPTSRRHWSVSYRLSVPARSDLDLTSMNGGISVSDVGGTIRLETLNGGLSLDSLSGDVSGRTTNGGVSATLAGRSWQGSGLDLTTTNGGVSLTIPEDFDAHVETGTVNGNLDVDFPVTVRGRVDRRLSVDLGRGGAPIRATTTNGGVRLRRR